MIWEHETAYQCQVACYSTSNRDFSVFVDFNMSVSVGSGKVDDPKFLQGREQICVRVCFFLIVHRKILQFLPKITMFSNGTSLLKWDNWVKFRVLFKQFKLYIS